MDRLGVDTLNKVIFLDIDGVLNSEKLFIERKDTLKKAYAELKQKEGFDRLYYDLDKTQVTILNEIIDKTQCTIVLSSSWRIYGLDRVNTNLQKAGFKYEIRYATEYAHKDRGIEILDFINKTGIANYIVIDDDSFDIQDHIPKERFIKTTWKAGIQQNHADKIIQVLNRSGEN